MFITRSYCLERLMAVVANILLLILVCLLVLNHVTQLGCLHVTFQAFEKLVYPTCSLARKIRLDEAQVGRILLLIVFMKLRSALKLIDIHLLHFAYFS